MVTDIFCSDFFLVEIEWNADDADLADGGGIFLLAIKWNAFPGKLDSNGFLFLCGSFFLVEDRMMEEALRGASFFIHLPEWGRASANL